MQDFIEPPFEELSEEPVYNADYRAGFVAIIGRPNAGKSTLLNSILEFKLAITTHKAQTTRHQILGILSEEAHQMIFLDTPGIIEPEYKLQEAMMQAVSRSAKDADVLLHLVDVTRPADEERVWGYMRAARKPSVLVINKVDAAKDGAIEYMKEVCTKEFNYKAVIEISAEMHTGLDVLKTTLGAQLPLSPPLYPPDQLSEHPVRFFVSELIREQIFLQYAQEIPYSCTVTVSSFKEEEKMDHIHAEIIVNRDSQKGILIGKGGLKLKKLGTKAREQIEQMTGKKANLQLFVKVREKWRDKESYLRGYGY
jgi:GTP-binding protein Era